MARAELIEPQAYLTHVRPPRCYLQSHVRDACALSGNSRTELQILVDDDVWPPARDQVAHAFGHASCHRAAKRVLDELQGKLLSGQTFPSRNRPSDAPNRSRPHNGVLQSCTPNGAALACAARDHDLMPTRMGRSGEG